MAIGYDVRDDHVAVITIDRPPRNALDAEHLRDLASAWRRFERDASLWAAIVTGSGNAFCTGADLKTFIPRVTELGGGGGAAVAAIEGLTLSDAMYAILSPAHARILKPIVAAVNGYCLAGGMELLCGTDIRIACPEAVFGVTEPKVGIFAGGGLTYTLPRQVPFPAAMELLLGADLVPAGRAREMGLVNLVVPRDEILDVALGVARRVIANDARDLQEIKHDALGAYGVQGVPRT